MMMLNGHDKITVQCDMPLLTAVSMGASPEQRAATLAAFDYWNDATGKTLFVDIGADHGLEMSDATAGKFLTVRFEEFEGTANARAYYRTALNGCLVNVRIVVNPSGLDDTKLLETVLRHEIGHALGLRDQRIDNSRLMYYSIDRTRQHPIDATDVEIEQVQRLYGGE